MILMTKIEALIDNSTFGSMFLKYVRYGGFWVKKKLQTIPDTP